MQENKYTHCILRKGLFFLQHMEVPKWSDLQLT